MLACCYQWLPTTPPAEQTSTVKKSNVKLNALKEIKEKVEVRCKAEKISQLDLDEDDDYHVPFQLAPNTHKKTANSSQSLLTTQPNEHNLSDLEHRFSFLKLPNHLPKVFDLLIDRVYPSTMLNDALNDYFSC